MPKSVYFLPLKRDIEGKISELFFIKEVSIDPTDPFKMNQLGSVRWIHLPFKMYYIGLRAFKSPLMHVGSIATHFYLIMLQKEQYV